VVSLALKVFLDHRDWLAVLEILALVVLLEALVLQASPGRRAHRGNKDLKEQLELPELKDCQETMVSKVLRASLVIPDRQDKQVNLGCSALRVNRVTKVRPE